MSEREREKWIRAREAEALTSLSPGAQADLERLRKERPDLAERFETLRDKVISAVFGQPPPTPSERDGHRWYIHIAEGAWTVTPNRPSAEPEFQQRADHAFEQARKVARQYGEAVIDAPDGSSYVLRWLEK